MSESHKCVKLSDETRRRMSEARAGKPVSEATIDGSRKYWTGRPKPVEMRQKISDSLKGKKQSPESIAKRVEKVKATWAAKRAALESA